MRKPREDLTGQKNGIMTMIGYSDENYRGKRLWIAECECGNVSDRIRAEHWKRGAHKSCGCAGATPVELGERFGLWTVVDVREKMTRKVRVRCVCNHERLANKSDLTHGRSKGCLNCGFKKNIKPDNWAAKNRVIQAYQSGARARSLEYTLTDEDFVRISSSPCHYCGRTNTNCENLASGSYFEFNGVDRKDNSIGYTLENSLPCCSICNRAKHAYGYDEFNEWLDSLVEFRATKLMKGGQDET